MYNEVWHEQQAIEKYQDVISKCQRIKIYTKSGNIYLYTRATIDDEFGSEILPYTWYINKNGIREKIEDPENPGEYINKKITIETLDQVIKKLYFSGETLIEVIIN